MVIKSVSALQVFDSRGFPTVECTVETEHGCFSAITPSGASTGKFEAVELRDSGSSYSGKGVMTAVSNIRNIIAPAVIGMNECDQRAIDTKMVRELDGSENEWGFNKGKLGANAILAVSMSVSRAAAKAQGMELYKYLRTLTRIDPSEPYVLPVPCFNVINGGSHAGNTIPMQEFMLVPVGAQTFEEAMQMGCETYHALKNLIKKKFGASQCSVGDEGGFAPNCDDTEALTLCVSAIAEANYTGKIFLGMDVAASEFYTDGKYDLGWKNPNITEVLDADALTEKYRQFCTKFPILSIEDPFDEEDFEAFANMTTSMGKTLQIVGDDLLVTNPKRIQKGIKTNACNCLLLKLNQIGTLTEAIDACMDAYAANWSVMVSHRSGETEDSFIADLVVGLSTGQIKSGAPCRSERLAKYNQLLRISEQGECVFNSGTLRHIPKLM